MAKAAQRLGKFATRVGASLSQKGPELVRKTTEFATPRLQTFWKYARVEMKPPSLSEMPQVQQSFQNIVFAARTGKYLQVPVREAFLNTLVCMEIAFWFFVGEIIGKGNLVGYYIPGAVHYESE